MVEIAKREWLERLGLGQCREPPWTLTGSAGWLRRFRLPVNLARLVLLERHLRAELVDLGIV